MMQDLPLASNLRALRLRAGCSRQELAEFLHVHRSTYAYYECGRSEPPIRCLLLLCQYYGLTLDELVLDQF